MILLTSTVIDISCKEVGNINRTAVFKQVHQENLFVHKDQVDIFLPPAAEVLVEDF